MLSRLGSRLYSLTGAISLLVGLVRGCEQGPAPCPDDICEGGAAGEAGAAGGGAGGSGGADAGGMAGAGGEGGSGAGGAPTGGQGGVGGQGGAGAGGVGGEAGAGGACVPSFACGPDDCGMVDDGCGTMLDCDAKDPETGTVITCATVGNPPQETGVMTCDPVSHRCVCAENGTPEALAMCEGLMAEPAVADWCAAAGGCAPAECGSAAAWKKPLSCIYSGQALKPNPQDPSSWVHVWCCADPS